MNHLSRKARHLRNARATMALTLCIGLGAITGDAGAQVVTIDPAHIAKDVANFAKTLQQYAKEIAQYQAVLQHYQQELVRFTHMDFSLPSMQNSYQEISSNDAAEQVARACPSTSSSGSGVAGAVSGLLQIFTPNANASILSNQRTICEQIQFRQIDKYNLTVRMMNRLEDYSKNLKLLQDQMQNGGDSEGAMAGTKGNIELNSTALDNEMKSWTGQINADDQMIGYMRSQQSVQARAIFRGSNTALGNVIQAATFAAAFH